MERAAAFLAEGDFKRAIMNASSALDANPVEVGAIRIIAKALDAFESPTAANWLSRLDSLQPGDTETTVAWALASLRIGDVASAEQILRTMKADQQETARFHFAAAKIAMAKRDTAGAAKHWAEACRLKPDDEGCRLALATIRLGSKRADEYQSAVDILSEIGRKPPKSLEALRALLGDALQRQEWKRAAGLADALVADPGAGFDDKLRRLATLRAMKAGAASGYLIELRDGALAKPDELYLLLMWMTQHDLSLMVSDWARTFRPDVITTPPTCVAVADAYVRTFEWEKLRDFLDGRAWGDLDYLRRTFLARALDRLGEGALSAQEWKDALSAARSREDGRRRLERMAKAVLNWKWNQRAEEVMWILSSYPDCPRWVLDGLWGLCLERSDTVQLQKISGMLSQSDSKSVLFRDNYSFFSLLIRSEDGHPQREAERLFKENPGKANVAMTLALSLYQQGKIAEAVALTGSLPPADLGKPQLAFYHSSFLTATGETAKAEEFLPAAQKWKMFPEERALLDRAKLTVAKAGEERGLAEAAKVARAARAAREAQAAKAAEELRKAGVRN